MINMFQEFFNEKILLDYDQLEDPEFVDDLTSFNGQKLDSKDILRSYDIGKSDYEEFVETRLIRRSVSLFDPIKKKNKLRLSWAKLSKTGTEDGYLVGCWIGN